MKSLRRCGLVSPWALAWTGRPVTDADGDTAGSSPNSFAQRYRSSVPLGAWSGRGDADGDSAAVSPLAHFAGLNEWVSEGLCGCLE